MRLVCQQQQGLYFAAVVGGGYSGTDFRAAVHVGKSNSEFAPEEGLCSVYSKTLTSRVSRRVENHTFLRGPDYASPEGLALAVLAVCSRHPFLSEATPGRA